MPQPVEQMLSAFRVVSDRAFSCAGHLIETRGDSLLTGLRDCLYDLCYTHRFTGTFQSPAPVREADPALLRELQNANTSRTAIEQGWRIEQGHESGKILASRNGVTRWFLPGHYLTGKLSEAPPEEGDAASIYMPRESTTDQQAFYMAVGETIGLHQEEPHQIRFYWNIQGTGAPLLMAELTRELNRFQVPFLLKCGNHVEMYQRIDAAILYTKRIYETITQRIVAAVYERVAQHVQPETPMFTRRLADGLAFAENPPGGQSFGKTRCMIVAETLRACYEQNRETVTDRVAELERQFQNRGIDPQRPYLNAGSRDYEFLPLT